jgi:hypothetical protein
MADAIAFYDAENIQYIGVVSSLKSYVYLLGGTL